VVVRLGEDAGEHDPGTVGGQSGWCRYDNRPHNAGPRQGCRVRARCRQSFRGERRSRDGIWRDVPRSFWERSLDRIADIFVREIETGIGDTGIKAGVIKVANDAEGVTPEGERVLRGAARALRRTGCPISTHHWAPAEVGRQQVEIFRGEGAPMERICIGHSADTTDVEYLVSLLEAGVYLSMDRYPGAEGRPDWRQRNATVKALIDCGWSHRLMLGHDYAPPPVSARHRDQGGAAETTRYLVLSTEALPALVEDGVSSETIDLMMREVPRRFLTGA
jgi:phosphotriesterase-related protein